MWGFPLNRVMCVCVNLVLGGNPMHIWDTVALNTMALASESVQTAHAIEDKITSLRK